MKTSLIPETINSQFLSYVIEAHEGEKSRMQHLWWRYRVKPGSVPILTRIIKSIHKINNKINTDHFSDVIDTKTGYMGNDVSIVIDKESDSYDQTENGDNGPNLDLLTDYARTNNSTDINSEMVKNLAIAGQAPRLLYVADNGGETTVKTTNLDPWECIYFYNEDITEPAAVLRYYNFETIVQDQAGKYEKKTLIKAEWYDDTEITFWVSTQEKDEVSHDMRFVPDPDAPKNPLKHMFTDIPIIPFINNEEMMGDCEKALPLIEDYDRVVSDISNEIQQIAMGFLKVKGRGLKIKEPKDDVDRDPESDNPLTVFAQTGVFPIPDTPTADIDFITKNLNDTVHQNHLDRIERNIYKVCKSVDFGQEDIRGNSPIIAYQIKTSGLQYKCDITERKMQSSLRKQYRLLTDYWREFRQGDIDVNDLDFVFTRADFSDIKTEAETLALLLGSVDRRFAYSLMKWIEDPDKALEDWEKQAEEQMQKQIDVDAAMEDEDEDEE
jgi:SPP1 family phage portal protein